MTAKLVSRLRWVALAGLGWVVVQNAWLSDDAFITFRTVDNWLHGYGLRWNVVERVQTYTNPLWMMLLAALHLVTHDVVVTSLVLSWALTVATVALLLRTPREHVALAFAIVVAGAASRAFVDYSTSGLENPLGHALVVVLFVFAARAAAPGLLELALMTSLLALARPDAILLALPLLAYETWRRRSARALGAVATGLLPLLMWELFSLFYYGFPFPNTAYAKLGSGVPAASLAAQGLRYLRNSLLFDPVTIAVLLAGLTVGLRGPARARALAAGVALYLLYVVRVGGDFMSGRFLSLPFAAALALCATGAECVPRRAPLFAIGLIAVSLLLGQSPIRTGPHRYDRIEREDLADAAQIADERGFYFPATNPLWGRSDPFPDHPWANWGREFRASGQQGYVLGSEMGMKGYYAGPGLHMIDRFGLVDPLVARLPAARVDRWRIGHFRRRLPDGYYDSLRLGQRLIVDPSVQQYDDVLRLITRGPLLDRQRLEAIVRMNLGRYDTLLVGAQ